MKRTSPHEIHPKPGRQPLPKPALLKSDQTHHYLPIPDDISRCGFYVTSVGHSTITPGMSYPPVQHPSLYHFNWQNGRVLPEFSLMLITAGEGLFDSEATGKIALRSGMAALLFPGLWHRYRPVESVGWTERWMHFNGEFPHLLLNQGIIDPKRAIITLSDWRKVEEAMRDLLTSIHDTPSQNFLLVSLQALGVLSLTIQNTMPATAPTELSRASVAVDSLATLAVEYIWSRSHLVLSVPDVAKTLGVTRRTLERHMLAFQGRSTLDEIIQCRFSRAERLLRETELPVKTVVDLAGFGSPENMRQVFLARTGGSSVSYRKRFRPMADSK